MNFDLLLMIMLLTFISYTKKNSQPMVTQLVSNSQCWRMCLSRNFILNLCCIPNFRLIPEMVSTNTNLYFWSYL